MEYLTTVLEMPTSIGVGVVIGGLIWEMLGLLGGVLIKVLSDN